MVSSLELRCWPKPACGGAKVPRLCGIIGLEVLIRSSGFHPGCKGFSGLRAWSFRAVCGYRVEHLNCFIKGLCSVHWGGQGGLRHGASSLNLS